MSQYTKLLNAIIKANLGKINKLIDTQIRAHGMDPMGSVTSGTESAGRINLGVCHATASASYSLKDLRGLSSFQISNLEIVSATSTNDGSTLVGDVSMSAALTTTMSITVGGKVSAGCGFIHHSVGLSGEVGVTGITLSARGKFEASVGDKLCLTTVDVGDIGLNYSHVSVHINGLGIFNVLLDPIVDIISSVVKGPVISIVEGAIRGPVNSGINGILPQCTSL